MKPLIPLLILVFLGALVAWLRRGNGSSFGQMVRDSDHAAWRGAVDDKRRELAELIASEPKRHEFKGINP